MKELLKEDEKLFDEMTLLSNGSNEESLLFFIDLHHDLLKIDPIRFIGLHISFYANKEDLIKSMQVVEYYKSSPYISMEVEDFLKEMSEELNKLKEPKKSEYDDEEIRKFLFSKNENAIVSALHVLSKKNIRNYLDLMKEFLSSNTPYKYKTLALFVLIEQHISEEIEFVKDGMNYYLNPSSMYLPFDQFDYLDTKAEIERKNENQEIIDNAIEVLNTVQIKNYPDSIIDEDNISLSADLLIEISRSFITNSVDYKLISKKYEIQEEKVKEMVSEILNLFNS